MARLQKMSEAELADVLTGPTSGGNASRLAAFAVGRGDEYDSHRLGESVDKRYVPSTESTETYNGWTNRETWAVNLHLTNDEALYNLARAEARKGKWGDELKDLVELIYEDVLHTTTAAGEQRVLGRQEARSLVADAGSLWRVNWREVRDSLVSE